MTALAASTGTAVGGGGYGTHKGDKTGGLCSLGFTALSNDSFKPQALTAGHCTADFNSGSEYGIVAGQYFDIAETLSSGDGGATGDEKGTSTVKFPEGGFRGTISEWRFGRPGQTDPDPSVETTPAGTKDVTSTDYALVDFPEGTKVAPKVSNWGAGAKKGDLLAEAHSVTSVGTPKVGEQVLRSGRTSGQKSGSVTYSEGWANIDGRMVDGFASNAHANHGDSGGAYISEDGQALGVLSGGGELNDGSELFWATKVPNALDQMGNKSRILVASKAKQSGDTVEPGQRLRGSGANGFDGGTFVDSNGTKSKVTVSGGTWAITAPKDEGEHTGKLYLTNKYSVSEPLELKFTVKKATPTPTETATTPAPTATATETPTDPAPSETATEDPTDPAPSQTATEDPTDPAPSETATEDPTTPAPTQTTSGTPSSPAPTSSNPADPEPSSLQIDPRRIALSKFVGDGDKDKSVGVEASVMGAEPGTKVSFSIKKKGVTAKKETVTADESGNATTRVWGLTSAQNKDVYLGTYGVTADFTEAEQPNAGGTVGKAAAQDAKAGGAKTLESTFSVVSDDAPDPGDDGNDDDNNGNGHLPRTGATVGVALGTAAGLLALGAGMVLMARRRRG
ncbi:trypsin-like serine protease [Brevibacterium sp. 5221]|uniref:Trypsin-like serine protease n=1 Tax=Brevibacterium rongguiense TaxID=2695267 RepID=A0A6N9HA61_9MICO|nr:S1 family peptidase [Brevibacterium rongguiense]MYM20938.1 trypsin-like serine protease [Brevibacterium rongguiense]